MIELSEVFTIICVYIVAALFALREKWFDLFESVKFARDGSGKTALVTGADGTIGAQVVNALKRQRYTVYAFTGPHCPRGAEVLDLRNPKAIDKVAQSFMRQKTQFDVIVFAAGTMLADRKVVSGVEEHVCVNLLGHAFLWRLLAPCRTKTTRTLWFSSCSARLAKLPPISELALSQYEDAYNAYFHSKLLLSIYVENLAKSGDLMLSVHPGVVPGSLYHRTNPLIRWLTFHVLPYVMRTGERASEIVLSTLFDCDCGGQYYEDLRAVRLAPSLERELRRKLFGIMETKLSEWSTF